MRVEKHTNRFILNASAQIVDSTWQQPGVTSDIASAAYRACVHPMKPIDKVFLGYFSDATTKGAAVKYFPGTALSGAAWHHGSRYMLSVKGGAADVLEHCSLSHTQREHLLLEAARRSTHGRVVIAFATGETAALPDSLERVRTLDFVGFVMIKPALA